MEYKVGTRVKCIKNIARYNTKNKIGRIICISNEYSIWPYGVQFDKNIGTCTDCRGHGKYGYCLWLNKEVITLYNSKQRIK